MAAWTLCDLFIAGSETTSIEIRWYFLYMIHHPEVQKRVHEEIDLVVGRDRCPSLDDRAKMPYTEATILEVLRLKPSLALGVPRMTNQRVCLGGYDIPTVAYQKSEIFFCSFHGFFIVSWD